MKSMTLVSDRQRIPLKIIELASRVNELVGDMNISVEISDNETGRKYRIEPNLPEQELGRIESGKVCPLLEAAR